MRRAVLSWSGGKDCSLALCALQDGTAGDSSAGDSSAGDESVGVESLLTTVTPEHDRVSMHGVRTSLVERQATALGLSLRTVEIPAGCAMDRYRDLLVDGLRDCRRHDVEAVVYADLHLEDVRAARKRTLERVDLTGRWPLWGRDTETLARAFVDLGFEARVVCVDAEALDRSFVGRRFDRSLLSDLPAGVDPCGENGEFHTFVVDGPPFERAVPVRVAGTTDRELGGGQFRYADLVAAD
ncbi:ATP-binding protein [Halobacteriales archaeon SW_7_71_33]|nr:MAG: ATP-binding protein [Halobacteriales archaeon SW_7_71_33]